MQNHLAATHGDLFFGTATQAARSANGHGAACVAFKRGPFVFRKRLVEGERIVAVGGEKAGKYGSVLATPADDDEGLLKPYICRFDDDLPESPNTALLPHQVRRIPADGAELRRVAFEHPEEAPAAAAPAPTELANGTEGGRREWSAEEVVVRQSLAEQREAARKKSALSASSAAAATLDDDGKAIFIFEACIPWDRRMAGRHWDLPTVASVSGHKGLLSKGDKCIRFFCPDTPSSQVVVHARLRVKPSCTEVSLPRLQPAPWSVCTQHWQAQGCIKQTDDGIVRLIEQVGLSGCI